MEELDFDIGQEIHNEILDYLNRTFKRNYSKLISVEIYAINYAFTFLNEETEQETRLLSKEYMTENTKVMGKIHPSFIVDELDEAITVEQ